MVKSAFCFQEAPLQVGRIYTYIYIYAVLENKKKVNRCFLRLLRLQYKLWYNNDAPCLPTENGVPPHLSLGLSTGRRMRCSWWRPPVGGGGVGALGSAREGTRCCVCFPKRDYSAARNLSFPEPLFGIFILPCPCSRLATVPVEARVGSPTGAVENVCWNSVSSVRNGHASHYFGQGWQRCVVWGVAIFEYRGIFRYEIGIGSIRRPRLPTSWVSKKRVNTGSWSRISWTTAD